MAQFTIANLKAIREGCKENTNEFMQTLSEIPYRHEEYREYREDVLCRLAREVLRAADNLRTETEIVTRRVSDVLRRINAIDPTYCGLNGAGELQAEGPRFDVLCALYRVAHDAFTSEVSSRERAEKEDAIKTKVGAYDLDTRAVIKSVRSSSQTIKQISRETELEEVTVGHALTLLIADGVVEKYGAEKRARYMLNREVRDALVA